MSGGLLFSDALVDADGVGSPSPDVDGVGGPSPDVDGVGGPSPDVDGVGGPSPDAFRIDWRGVDAKAAPKRPRAAPKCTATVGGVDFSMGGWAAYEAVRRRAERDMRPCTTGGGAGKPRDAFYAGSPYYTGRTAIGGRTAAESLLAARPPGALKRAAAHLSKALGGLEDALCDPDEDGLWECAPPTARRGFPSIVVPPLTSADVDAFIKEDFTSPEDLYMIANDAIATAATLQTVIAQPPILKNRPLPALPARAVSISDDNAVTKLESAVIPYVTHIEELQSAVASILDKTASAIDAKLAKIKSD